MPEPAAPPERTDGFLPIAAYAAIGDGRTAALVGADGSIDWLCLPGFDGQLVLAGLLDPQRGGRFALAPVGPYRVARGYVDGTNVLRTEFTTPDGTAAVTDGMGVGEDAGVLVRRVEGLAGRVRLAWTIAPHFDAGLTAPWRIEPLAPGAVVRGPGLDLAVAEHGGEGRWVQRALVGELALEAGEQARLTLACGSAPVAADRADAALEGALEHWRDYRAGLHYDGPWREAVLRSAMALRLLVFEPSGAMAAAATTSLPETPGGSRNYDYRFCWLRDASFAVDAFVRLGDERTAGRFMRFMTDVLRDADGPPEPFYTLHGGRHPPQSEPPLAGYRGAKPVRLGNGAVDQRQLGTYGDVLQAAALFAGRGGDVDEDLGALLARFADGVCDAWEDDDAGIWEITPYRPHTWSKMACWVALERAGSLADDGRIPADGRERWGREAERIRAYVEERCWSERAGCYLGTAGRDDLDAATLLGVFMDYRPADPRRWHRMVDRLGAELGAGELLWRTTELRDREATFLPCAFWRVHALSRLRRLDEAAALMDALVARANDVGLLSEEMTASGEMLGNIPQALTHGALVNAAATFQTVSEGRDPRDSYAT